MRLATERQQSMARSHRASLYKDFKHYSGNPSPYVGNGRLWKDPDGKKTGHVMLIAGYDDARGAVRIQNSWAQNGAKKGSCGWPTTP